MKLAFILIMTGLTAVTAQTPAPAAAQTAQGIAPSASAYRFVPGDVVEVRFFFNPELNEQVQIRPDGFISMALIGEYQIAGKTVSDVRQELETRFAQEIKTPRITVQVRTYGSQKVFVTGEVVRPGVIALPGQTTVLAALNESGGITRRGDTTSIVLLRKGEDGKPVARTLALGKLRSPGPDAMLALQPLDVIIVPESKIARADRWVDQYIRQLSPAMLNFGFNYLFQNNPSVITF